MNQSIIYRPFQKEDANQLARVISDSWNYEKMFSKNVAYHFSHIFLYYELARQSFTQVAHFDGTPAGIIAGDIKGERKPLNNWAHWPKIIYHASQLLFSKEGRSVLNNYVKVVDSLNKKMFGEANESFGSELALFAVSPKAQGLGIGSALFKYYIKKLNEKRVEKYFLYTDTTCNFEFYEYKGLKRISSVKNRFSHPINDTIELYIYKGEN